MLGGTSLIKLENDLSVAINHVNSFEVQSSSLDTATYYNPVTNLQLEYAKKINNLNYKLNLDFGGSTRGWQEKNGSTIYDVSGGFFKGSLKATNKRIMTSIGFSYVDPDFRSAGAQSRRVNYISAPSSYAYYTNNTLLRPVSMMDIATDPSIYNNRLSTSLMHYNTLYTAVTPYGEATPNRAGTKLHFEYKNKDSSVLASTEAAYYKELIGQGTTEKRALFSSGLMLTAHLDKLTPLKNKTSFELSVSNENVERGGSDLEAISFNSMLLSAGLSYELFKNLKIIGGVKSFAGKGNEVGSQRDEYDQVVGYELLDFDSQEDILMLGLQYNFTNDIYFSLQTNKIDIDDKTSEISKLSLSRIYFMFNMNL